MVTAGLVVVAKSTLTALAPPHGAMGGSGDGSAGGGLVGGGLVGGGVVCDGAAGPGVAGGGADGESGGLVGDGGGEHVCGRISRNEKQ